MGFGGGRAEIGSAGKNVGQHKSVPLKLFGCMGLLVCRRRRRRQGRKTHFIFLSFPEWRVLSPAPVLSLHRSLCTRTCHQFPRRRCRRYHISAAVKARPLSPIPLSVSLPAAPRSRVFETVSFLRRELFSFLGVTRNRVTDGGGRGGGGRGARSRPGASSPRSSRRGGRIGC